MTQLDRTRRRTYGPVVNKPEGGFRFISGTQLAMAWCAYKTRAIAFQDLRVYWAAHEAEARRSGAGKLRIPRFEMEELRRLTGARHCASVRGSIVRLRKAGLLTWTERSLSFAKGPLAGEIASLDGMLAAIKHHKRPIPVPRRVLRFLASGARRAVAAVVLGHLFRCVFYRQGCTSLGMCKSSWVAKTFGVALSRAKEARAHLVGMGLLEVERGTAQRVLNRHGAIVRVNLEWRYEFATLSPGNQRPLRARRHLGLRPPLRNKELPSGSRNQKPDRNAVRLESGFQKKKARKEGPTLHDVVLDDLRSMPRLMELFRQAERGGLVSGTEADRFNFVAAAMKATAIGSRNPCGLFLWIVKRGFPYLAHADETAARRTLEGYLSGSVERSPKDVQPVQRSLSEDAWFVRALRQTLARRGAIGDPFPALQEARPDWSLERWNRALQELR